IWAGSLVATGGGGGAGIGYSTDVHAADGSDGLKTHARAPGGKATYSNGGSGGVGGAYDGSATAGGRGGYNGGGGGGGCGRIHILAQVKPAPEVSALASPQGTYALIALSVW
ncbi:MAG: hypothetical protein KAI47_04505, partial [Deltaproteobacteria bacterium]|nr:hypothetical protein [Deltaproteobacteria bacterium]